MYYSTIKTNESSSVKGGNQQSMLPSDSNIGCLNAHSLSETKEKEVAAFESRRYKRVEFRTMHPDALTELLTTKKDYAQSFRVSIKGVGARSFHVIKGGTTLFIIENEIASHFAVYSAKKRVNLVASHLFPSYGTEHEAILFKKVPEGFTMVRVKREASPREEIAPPIEQALFAGAKSIDRPTTRKLSPIPITHDDRKLDDRIIFEFIEHIESLVVPAKQMRGKYADVRDDAYTAEAFRILRDCIACLETTEYNLPIWDMDLKFIERTLLVNVDKTHIIPTYSDITYATYIAIPWLLRKLICTLIDNIAILSESVAFSLLECIEKVANSYDRNESYEKVDQAQMWSAFKAMRCCGVGFSTTAGVMNQIRQLLEQTSTSPQIEDWIDLSQRMRQLFVGEFSTVLTMVRTHLVIAPDPLGAFSPQLGGCYDVRTNRDIFLWRILRIRANRNCSEGEHRLHEYCKHCNLFPIASAELESIEYKDLFLKQLHARYRAQGKVRYVFVTTTGETLRYNPTSNEFHHELSAVLSLDPINPRPMEMLAQSESAHVMLYPCALHLLIRDYLSVQMIRRTTKTYNLFITFRDEMPILAFEFAIDNSYLTRVTKVYENGWRMIVNRDVIIRSSLPTYHISD